MSGGELRFGSLVERYPEHTIGKICKGHPCGRCPALGRHWDWRGWRCDLHQGLAWWETPPGISATLDPAGRDPLRRWPNLTTRTGSRLDRDSPSCPKAKHGGGHDPMTCQDGC
jgi:hypothetical protein